jgi:hypothetical protein
MSKILLESRWDETKEALLEGLKGTRKSTMGVILENTKRQLLAESSAGTTTAGNIATLNRVILPVIRRVMPTVIANELVGVQPMTGPVGQIHTLRVRYAQSLTDNSAAQTSVTAGEEALSPFKIAQAYSRTPGGAANPTVTSYTANDTAAMEGNGGRQISVQILRQAVEAKSRKLQARWTFEAAQDAQSQHGQCRGRGLPHHGHEAHTDQEHQTCRVDQCRSDGIRQKSDHEARGSRLARDGLQSRRDPSPDALWKSRRAGSTTLRLLR